MSAIANSAVPLVLVEDVHTYYGKSHILHGVSLTIAPGEVVGLLGRNGVGKSTTLKTIMGLVHPSHGTVLLDGNAITGLPPHKLARLGIGYVPEDRRIFRLLTVMENLRTGLDRGGVTEDKRRALLDKVFTYFPVLAERRSQAGGTLSGGEQQMLAIGRILRTGARFLMLDEPTEGLAPVIIQQIGQTIKRLKSEGFTILLVEQNFRFAATVADRYYIVEHGKIIDGFANAELQANMDKLHTYLGV
jgi:branched-chain amino acid transport system ATP-binding protein